MKKLLLLVFIVFSPILIISQEQKGSSSEAASSSISEAQSSESSVSSSIKSEETQTSSQSSSEQDASKKFIKILTIQDILDQTAIDKSEEKVEKKVENKVDKVENKEEMIKSDEGQTFYITKNTLYKGDVSSLDYVIEKKGEIYTLWIKKRKDMQSVGLITVQDKWDTETKYFLRSPYFIKEQDSNTIKYSNRKIGNADRLYFLVSSKVKKHPQLGKAFKIIVPEKLVYGYNAVNSYGEINVIPGKTEIVVRIYDKPNASGHYIDNTMVFPEKKDIKVIEQNLRLVSKQITKKNIAILEFVYSSPNKDAKKVILEENGKEYEVYNFSNPKKFNKEYSDRYLYMIQWSNNYKAPEFEMRFYIFLDYQENRKVILRVRTDKENVNYDINF